MNQARRVYTGMALEPYVMQLDWVKYHDSRVHLTIQCDGLTLLETTALGQSGTHPRCSKWDASAAAAMTTTVVTAVTVAADIAAAGTTTTMMTVAAAGVEIRVEAWVP